MVSKVAKPKTSAIEKDHVPSNLVSKAVPLLTARERDIPEDLLRGLGNLSLAKTLSTLGGLGVVLRPREFQRIVLVQLSGPELADELKDRVFPKVEEEEDLGVGPENFLETLVPLLSQLVAPRSGLGPVVEQRVVMALGAPEEKKVASTSHSSPLLRKIGAAYNGYRRSLMTLAAHSQNLVGASGARDGVLSKLAAVPHEQLFTPLAVGYLQTAFMDEVGSSAQGVVHQGQQASAGAEKGSPFRDCV